MNSVAQDLPCKLTHFSEAYPTVREIRWENVDEFPRFDVLARSIPFRDHCTKPFYAPRFSYRITVSKFVYAICPHLKFDDLLMFGVVVRTIGYENIFEASARFVLDKAPVLATSFMNELTILSADQRPPAVGIELGRASSQPRFPRPPYNPGRPDFPGPV